MFYPDLNFPDYVSIPRLVHPLYGSDIVCVLKEALDSVLLTLQEIPSAQYIGSEHLTFLRAGLHTEFILLSCHDERKAFSVALDLSGIDQESVSSTAATVKTVDPSESNHPNWAVNVKQATKDFTLSMIASIDF
jgi:hypothetical protein